VSSHHNFRSGFPLGSRFWDAPLVILLPLGLPGERLQRICVQFGQPGRSDFGGLDFASTLSCGGRKGGVGSDNNPLHLPFHVGEKGEA
jgi:hypothetical protein